MSTKKKGGFPPLLAPGLHPMPIRELEQKCVTAFPKSKTRQQIWKGLAFVLGKLEHYGVKADAWIDGSFLTLALDPQDVDIVLCVEHAVYNSGSQMQQEALDWINDNLREAHLCDSYRFFVYPQEHPLHEAGEAMRTYWLDQFGTDHDGNTPKGIAVISVGPKRGKQ